MTKEPRSGRLIPWILGGAFFFSLSINGLMTWIAISSHPGVSVEHAYERGLAHNEALHAAAAVAVAGWQPQVLSVRDGSIRISLLAADGAPLSASEVAGRLRHPARSGQDMALTFTSLDSGGWSATPAHLPSGQWDLELDVRSGDDRLQNTRRIVLP